MKDKLEAIRNAGFQGTDDAVSTFKSYYLKNTSYHVKDKKTLRDSSVCEFEDEGIRRLGSVRKFCILIEGPFAILN